MNSLLPVIYKGAFMWSMGGFVVVSITVLACASPDYSTAKFVFTDFINQTGCKYNCPFFTVFALLDISLTNPRA